MIGLRDKYIVLILKSFFINPEIFLNYWLKVKYIPWLYIFLDKFIINLKLFYIYYNNFFTFKGNLYYFYNFVILGL